MTKRHGINQQISTLNVIRAGIARTAIRDIESYDQMVNFHLLVLDEVIATLGCIQVHETVIREAIKNTQTLDDSEKHG